MKCKCGKFGWNILELTTGNGARWPLAPWSHSTIRTCQHAGDLGAFRASRSDSSCTILTFCRVNVRTFFPAHAVKEPSCSQFIAFTACGWTFRPSCPFGGCTHVIWQEIFGSLWVESRTCKWSKFKCTYFPFLNNELILPSHWGIGAEHISFCTICLSHPNIWAFSSWRKLRVLIEIPLPQVTEQDDHALHSEASQPSSCSIAWSSNIPAIRSSSRSNNHISKVNHCKSLIAFLFWSHSWLIAKGEKFREYFKNWRAAPLLYQICNSAEMSEKYDGS